MKPKYLAAGTTFTALATACAIAQTTSLSLPPSQNANPTTVVAIVTVVKPWYAPSFLVVNKMRDTQTQYATLPGLAYKIYSVTQADSQFGGIYLWRDRTAAQGWFSPAWFERVRKERGVEGTVRMFDAPVILDNTPGGTPSNERSDSVATLVTIPIPLGIAREKLVAEFNAAVPTYQRVPGLLRKYFIITDDGKFGGVYLWDKQASGNQWFNESWQQRVRQTYGAAATLEWFNTPILLPTQTTAAKVNP